MVKSSSGPRPPVIVAGVVGAVVAVILILLLLREVTYRAVVTWADGFPDWVQATFQGISDYGVFVLAAMFLLAALLARSRSVNLLARGIAAGVGVVLAYVASEIIKTIVTEARPCHTYDVETIGTCPAPTDWAWPSNHTTVAVAIAIAVLVMSVRIGLVALPLAGLIGLSRVVIGVHYFHDVLSGALLGTVMVIVLARWGTPWVVVGLERARRVPALDLLISGGTDSRQHR